MTPRVAFPVLLTSILSACGGGGGDSSAPVAVQPPVVVTPSPPPVPPVVPNPVPDPVTPPPATPAPTPAPPATAPFALLSVDPAAGTVGVARTASVVATFGSDLAAAPVNAASVALLSPEGAAIPAALSVTGSQFRLTPLAVLPGDTTYTVRLASNLADVNGRTLSVAQNTSFTTAAQSWGDVPAIVQTMPKSAVSAYPAAVVDRAGNVTATWKIAGSNSMYAARFDAASGKWSAPVVAVLAEEHTVYAGPLIALANGDVLQFSLEYPYDTTREPRLRQTRFDSATSTWTVPATLNLLSGGLTVESLRVSADEAGNLTALMINSSKNALPALYAARFQRSSGSWGEAVRLDHSDGTTSQPLSFSSAADRAGNVFATWQEGTASAGNLMAARFDITTGRWSEPVLLAEKVSAGGSPGTLAVNSSGVAVAIWNHGNGPGQAAPVHVARFDPASGGWSGARRINTSYLPTAYPQIVLDAAGFATASWVEQPYRLTVVSARFDPATLQWSAPSTVSTGGYVPMVQPKLAIDVAGNVMLAFNEDQSMKAVRFRSSDRSWGSVASIGKHTEGMEKSVLEPTLVMDAGGVVTAVWYTTNQRGSTVYDNEIVANRFK
ncbi:MAG: Ig-like domain-containing protein [Pseudomonadota bacterium]